MFWPDSWFIVRLNPTIDPSFEILLKRVGLQQVLPKQLYQGQLQHMSVNQFSQFNVKKNIPKVF